MDEDLILVWGLIYLMKQITLEMLGLTLSWIWIGAPILESQIAENMFGFGKLSAVVILGTTCLGL